MIPKEPVSSFDVMKLMSERDLDIRLATLYNVTNLQKTKHGTLITIGVEGDLVAAIGIQGKFVGGLILCDAKQYNEIKKELEART